MNPINPLDFCFNKTSYRSTGLCTVEDSLVKKEDEKVNKVVKAEPSKFILSFPKCANNDSRENVVAPSIKSKKVCRRWDSDEEVRLLAAFNKQHRDGKKNDWVSISKDVGNERLAVDCRLKYKQLQSKKCRGLNTHEREYLYHIMSLREYHNDNGTHAWKKVVEHMNPKFKGNWNDFFLQEIGKFAPMYKKTLFIPASSITSSSTSSSSSSSSSLSSSSSSSSSSNSSSSSKKLKTKLTSASLPSKGKRKKCITVQNRVLKKLKQ